jgi:glycosyltransferase involved in cell wall biosynthesis
MTPAEGPARTPPRSLFLAPNLAAGGTERQLSVLLPALRARGFDARLVALDAGGPFEQPLREAGVPLEVLQMRSQLDLGPLLRSAIVRRFAPQVVLSSGVSGLYVGTAIAARHAAVNIHQDHMQVGYEFSRRLAAMLKLICPRLDVVVCVAREQAGAWRQRGYPEQRIEVIANGVEGHEAGDSSPKMRHELGLPDSAVVALLGARLRPEKRVPDFVRAVIAARRSCPQLVGVIAGDGPDRAAVEAAAAGADPGSVLVLGHRDDMSELMHAADMFVLVSEIEAVPMAILEAMAAGLPVVSTAIGGIPSVVQDGVSGRLVAAGQVDAIAAALAELGADPGLRARMGETARGLHAERFSAAGMIDAYATLLCERAAAGSRAARPRYLRRPRLVPGTANRKL